MTYLEKKISEADVFKNELDRYAQDLRDTDRVNRLEFEAMSPLEKQMARFLGKHGWFGFANPRVSLYQSDPLIAEANTPIVERIAERPKLFRHQEVDVNRDDFGRSVATSNTFTSIVDAPELLQDDLINFLFASDPTLKSVFDQVVYVQLFKRITKFPDLELPDDDRQLGVGIRFFNRDLRHYSGLILPRYINYAVFYPFAQEVDPLSGALLFEVAKVIEAQQFAYDELVNNLLKS